MAKYKVLQDFQDIETNEVYGCDQEIEMTVKRADEAVKNLSKYEGEFLERTDNKKEDEEEGKKDQEDGV